MVTAHNGILRLALMVGVASAINQLLPSTFLRMTIHRHDELCVRFPMVAAHNATSALRCRAD
jgi:hypothetical protein